MIKEQGVVMLTRPPSSAGEPGANPHNVVAGSSGWRPGPVLRRAERTTFIVGGVHDDSEREAVEQAAAELTLNLDAVVTACTVGRRPKMLKISFSTSRKRETYGRPMYAMERHGVAAQKDPSERRTGLKASTMLGKLRDAAQLSREEFRGLFPDSTGLWCSSMTSPR